MLATRAGEVVLHAPVVYQEIDGERRPVDGAWALRDEGRAGFTLGHYDVAQPLIIDPVLEFSTYLGGSGSEDALDNMGVALDASGNIYIAGTTDSADFPTTGDIQDQFVAITDAFVVKLDPSGSQTLYATYLGGDGLDSGQAVAVDEDGNAYVGGFTSSTDFPTLAPLQGTSGGDFDGFVAKLDPTGSSLVYSTYIGGSGRDFVLGIDVDDVGQVYMTGDVESVDFPTLNPLQPVWGGVWDAWAAKLTASGDVLAYSTYLGGSFADSGLDIKVDANGFVYVAGFTISSDFPTANAFQDVSAGDVEAYVLKLAPDGSAFVYSTFLGGDNTDRALGIDVDNFGNAYVVGDSHDETFQLARARPERHANIELSSSRARGVRQDATQPDERHARCLVAGAAVQLSAGAAGSSLPPTTWSLWRAASGATCSPMPTATAQRVDAVPEGNMTKQAIGPIATLVTALAVFYGSSALTQGLSSMRAKALGVPYRGVTTDGNVLSDLFSIRASGVSTAPVKGAAEEFLGGLTKEQHAKTVYAVDDIEWRRWDNVHRAPRQGVRFGEMNEAQRELAYGLLRASLSAKGLEKSRNVMRLNEHLAELTSKRDEYGEGLYHLTVMGEPSETKPWGWQLDGHHLAINYFVLGDQVVMTPAFMGSEPVEALSGKYIGVRVMQEEQDQGLALMEALSPEQQSRAILSTEKTRVNALAQAYNDNLVLDYAGIPASELTPEQRSLLRAVIEEYVGNMDDGHAKIRMGEVEAHLDATYFAWIGDTGPDSVFYYRVHSPVILIEFDHQGPIALEGPRVASRRHVHSVVRTPNGNDYGKDLLRQHYEAHQNDREHGHLH